MRRFRGWWRERPGRVRFAVCLLFAVSIGWPTTSILDLMGFPIFRQVMYALSWVAPALTAVDILFTAQVHEMQDLERVEADRDVG